MADILPMRPIRWNELRPDEAERHIRSLVTDSNNVIVGDHAFARIDERSITRTELMHILATGHIKPDLNKLSNGDWEVIVTKRMKGKREAGVVTIILRQKEKLFVKTVMWMDQQ